MKPYPILFLLFILSLRLSAQVMWDFRKDTVIAWYYNSGDEFTGDTVNTQYWTYALWARSLYMNHEQQYYTDGRNHKVADGTLRLIARKENITAKTVDYKGENDSLIANKKFLGLNKRTFEYTSGKLATRQTYNKGYFECRFKIPSQHGYWPAFWLHGGDPNEEIDMMECETKRPHDLHIDTHCPNRCDMMWAGLTRKSFGTWLKTRTNFAGEFNVMACEWDEDRIRFYLNGEYVAVSRVSFGIPKHLTINLAVPSTKGPFGPGPSAADSIAMFEVDYVRVWTKSNAPVNAEGTRNFEIKDASDSLRSYSILKKKVKAYYGRKKETRYEGIKITLFQRKNTLDLTVLGNVEGEMPRISLATLDKKIVLEKELFLSNQSLSLEGLPTGEHVLNITWKGRMTAHIIRIQ